MSDKILDTIFRTPDTKIVFTAAVTSPPLDQQDEDDESLQQLPDNGRTTGRYARQGIKASDCVYGC